jgi:5'-methylthioadenosine phosphorylase
MQSWRMSPDYDVWHISEETVSVEMVIEILHRNTQVAQQAIKNLADMVQPGEDCACQHALAAALITQPSAISPQARERLGLLVEKYLK